MSPTKSTSKGTSKRTTKGAAKGKKPTLRTHSRAEVMVAVWVSVGIVIATLLLIWALRPGEPGVPGGGGLLSRQSRVSVLVVLGIGVLALAIWWVLNGRRRPRRVNRRVAVAVTSVVVIVGVVLAGVFWPGGVVKHYPKLYSDTDLTTPIQTPSIPPNSTKTTKPGKTSGTTAPGATRPSATATPTTQG
jgi:hypothetical protein